MHSFNTPVEREFTLDEALHAGLREIAKLPYQFESCTVGTIYPASHAKLKLQTGEVILEACGKNGWINSQVGAIYESIQDFYANNLDDRFMKSGAMIYRESSIKIAKQNYLQCDLVGNILKTLPDQEISYRYYQTYDGDKTVMIPLFISNVNYLNKHLSNPETTNYLLVQRYASDNGHSAGLGLDEALLHAVNECIERDSFSKLLYNCFYKNKPEPLPIIEKASLPEYLLNNLLEVERVIGSSVILIDMTTNTEISSILCIATRYYFGDTLMGMGTSLYASHAIDRAISEMMQSYWLRNKMTIEEKNKLTEYFNNKYNSLISYPNHLRCSKLAVADFLEKNYCTIKSFSALPTWMDAVSPAAQIKYLVQKLKSLGLEVFYCLLMQAEDTGVVVVHAFIPGMEYLWASASGQIVVPYKRLIDTSS